MEKGKETRHVAIVKSQNSTYVSPPMLLVTPGDTVVFHTVPRRKKATLNLTADLFVEQTKTVSFQGEITLTVRAFREGGEYEYAASFDDAHVLAMGGSFPKVIIY